MCGQVLNISADIQTYSTVCQGNFFLYLATFTIDIFFSLVLRWSFMCFNLCLLPLVLSVSTTEKRLAPLSSLFPIRYFYVLIRFPLSFPFSRLNSPSLASPLIYKMLKCLDHLHDSSLRGVPSEGLQRMVQMFSIPYVARRNYRDNLVWPPVLYNPV